MLFRFAAGAALGAGLMLFSTFLLLLLRAYRVERVSEPPEVRHQWFANPLLMLAVVFLEEAFARSLLVGVVSRHLGVWPALILGAVAFTALHIPNGVPNPWTLADLVAFSVLAGALYLRYGLALVTGLHWAWNVVQWPVLGYPLYGHRVGTLFRMQPQREEWLSGGRYGPESSVIVAAVEAVAAAAAVFMLRPL